MDNPRIEALRKLLASRPDDARAHFGLAVEYERLARWPDVVAHIESYLRLADDQGNAYGRLARARLRTGDTGGAREAFRLGIQAAERHGHPSMVMELQDELEALGD